MKTISKLILISSLILVSFACKEEMGKIDNRLTAVKELIEPVNAKTVELLATTSASLYFEWKACSESENGTALYQIAFDKTSGDFSNPVFIMQADNNGLMNYTSISHKQMNKIAGMIGIGASDVGTFKWTVLSSKGLKTLKAEQENTITIKRLAGFDEVPIDVYVTGEASEGGNDLSKAHKMRAVAGGEFEVYTKLSAGKPFFFSEDIKGTPRKFYTDGGLIKEDGTTTVATEGIYRITLDFNIGACTYALVTRIGFYFSPSGAILFDIPYIGNGIFQAKNQTVTFKQESWGRDERYKFRMFMKENGGADAEKEYEWGTLNSTDSRPTSVSPVSYYYVKLFSLPYNDDRWSNKWKLMADFDGVPATYTLYLQADQPYTHSVVK